jgi:hypothetical protein
VQTLQLTAAGRVLGFLYLSADDADREFARSGTAYPETGAFKSVCVPPLDQDLFGLLAHEANHVILWNGLGRAGTTFFSEGLPSAVISEHTYPSGPTAAHGWVARNITRVPPLQDLLDDDTFSNYPEDLAYNTSASFLAYLIATYGPSPLKAVHGATSTNIVRRFADVYQRPLAELETDWKRAIRERTLP